MGRQQARGIAAVFMAASLALLAGCQGSSSSGAAEGTGTPQSSATPAQLSLSLADGAVDVSPTTPLEVGVTGGDLGDVTVTDGAGTAVPGSVGPAPEDPATTLWTPEQPLGYGTSYTVTATAANGDDDRTTATSTYTTETAPTTTPDKAAAVKKPRLITRMPLSPSDLGRTR